MGNENLSLQQQPTPLRKTTHAHLGPTTLMQLQHHHCLLKTFSFADHYLLQDCHRKLKSRVGKNHPSVLNIHQILKKQFKQICANNFQLLVYVELFDDTLKSLLQKKLHMKKNYSEDELYTFMAQCVDALIFIQDNGLRNIQLDCQSIVFVGDQVKVLDSGIAMSKTYQQLLSCLQKGQKSQANLYLAPELIKELEDANYDPYISPKADIFSLGMILMEMVGLQSMVGYYDYHRSSIDYDSLIHRLSRINHSLPFKTLIAQMLQYDPEERIGLVSLKEKIQRLRTTEQGMSRSKSSKMLQDILSNSRKTSSISKQTERSCSLKRQQNSGKKSNRIEMRYSNKKTEDMKMQTQPSLFPLTDRNTNLSNLPESNPRDLKNLVKNKLTKNKQSKPIQSTRQPLPQPKSMLQSKKTLEQSHNNFDCSITSHKPGTSERSGKQSSKGVSSTLNKLVEESGMKKLLKIQQLDIANFNKSQDSYKNTSRFGSYQQSINREPQKNVADIYIQEYKENCQRIQTVVFSQQRNQKLKIHQDKTLHKVMTFNKQSLLNARSVQNSIQNISRIVDTSPSKLSLSPINPTSQQKQPTDSLYKNITIKDVPVVISQQKQMQDSNPPSHFGQLQRQLNLFDQATVGQSINNSINNTSNVIQHYRPNEQGSSSKKENPFAPFKKQRPKKPHLVIELDHQQQDFTIQPYTDAGRPSYQITRHNQSIDYLSNFTSISPPKITEQSSHQLQLMGKDTEQLDQSLKNRVRLANGDEYEGQMLGEIPHGNGVLYKQGKILFSGSFNLGKYSGYGTLFNLNFSPQPVDYRHIDLSQPSWNRFQGQFDSGMMSGFGTIFFEYQKFSGCLKNGVIQGYGCFYGKNGELVSGLWSQNKYRKV